VTQAVEQLLALPSQAKGAHEGVPGPAAGEQIPNLPGTAHESHAPLHASRQQTPSTQTALAHSPARAQAIPAVSFDWHLPATQAYPDLQSASSSQPAMQPATPSHQEAPHSPAGSLPAWTGLQVPNAPATAQVSHFPLQAFSQHTPSAQKPDWHWSARWQAPPTSSFPAHVPWTQAMPGLHSAVIVQAVSHAADVPLQ